ncbi:hypothetical protein GPJ56_000801 [Histomonas meleagridis]|uniref:uncharacterized protein n=1 Tax=Histomonas meleagridis TaxID=135588 RepID=UPI00355983EA|nr:hypothetical protein GPJ56_000801 [Histomonas meleagridis]KAH0804440.1 hypothetical protein GO595_003270 [Histomonas meleagridis]
MIQYSLDLASALISKSQFNNIIKDFLKSIPNDANDKHDTFLDSKPFYDDFHGIEQQIEEDEYINQAIQNINTLCEDNSYLYSSISNYYPSPTKQQKSPTKAKDTHTLKEQLAKEQQRKKELFRYQKQLRQNPISKSTLKTYEQQHLKFISQQPKLHNNYNEPQTPQQISPEAKRKNYIEFGKKATAMNKENAIRIKNTIKPLNPVVTTPVKKSIPFATDLNLFEQKISNEINEIEELDKYISEQQYEEINVSSIIKRIIKSGDDEDNKENEETDYHKQFMQLFQRIERIEEEVKELETKAEHLAK